MTIVFVHGLGQHACSWQNVVADLETDDELMLLDMFSAGENEDLDYHVLYQKLCKVCGNADGPVRLCGLSLGAVLAMNYAVDYPEKVESLILIAPQYKMPKMLLSVQNFVFRFMPEAAFAEMGMTKKGLIKICASMRHLDFTDKIKAIKCPVLVLCGEKDHANLKSAKLLKKKLHCAELSIIGNAGHELNVQVPERLAQVINEFWK